MGKFVAPQWQRGYRYISMGKRVIAVRPERPVPILMMHDVAGSNGGKTDFCVLSRVGVLVNTDQEREWFHDCGSRKHVYHPSGIQNSAKTVGSKNSNEPFATVFSAVAGGYPR